MGLSENRVYSQWNSHFIGIMISKTIGFRGTLFSDTPKSSSNSSLSSLSPLWGDRSWSCWWRLWRRHRRGGWLRGRPCTGAGHVPWLTEIQQDPIQIWHATYYLLIFIEFIVNFHWNFIETLLKQIGTCWSHSFKLPLDLWWPWNQSSSLSSSLGWLGIFQNGHIDILRAFLQVWPVDSSWCHVWRSCRSAQQTEWSHFVTHIHWRRQSGCQVDCNRRVSWEQQVCLLGAQLVALLAVLVAFASTNTELATQWDQGACGAMWSHVEPCGASQFWWIRRTC